MKKYVKATTLKAYLEKFTSDPMKYDENLASFVNYDNGTANFWIHPETGKWTLVIMDENTYNPDTYIYEGKYYGDEELMDENCNDIQLTTDQLYSELQKLPGVDLQNFYGMRNLIDELDQQPVVSSTTVYNKNKREGITKRCYRLVEDLKELRHDIDTFPEDYSWYEEALGDAEDAVRMLAHALEQV